MKEFINKIMVTGILVSNGLEKKHSEKGEYIGGDLIVRTADGSEHEIGLFSYRYKKDAAGNFTQEESKLYKAYETIINEYKSIEKCPNDPDVISITNGNFSPNDYKDKTTGELKYYTQLSTKFVNRVEKKDYETTVQDAKFEVEGIISKLEDEVYKEVPTGNMRLTLNAIECRKDGFGKDAKVSVNSTFPVVLIVPSQMVAPFKEAGYYEGAFAKFNGKIINTKEIVKTVEKQAFGEDLVKTVTKTIKRLEISSGNAPVTIYDVELTDDIVNQLIAKRKLKLSEIKSGANETDTTSTSTTSQPPINPFANPFATK